jgi:hypothetical protein
MSMSTTRDASLDSAALREHVHVDQSVVVCSSTTALWMCDNMYVVSVLWDMSGLTLRGVLLCVVKMGGP